MKRSWQLSLRVVAILALIVSLVWFFVEPGFGQLIGILTAVTAWIASIEKTKPILQQAIDDLESPDEKSRMDALDTLGHMEDPEAHRMLQRAAKKHKIPAVRIQSSLILAGKNDRAAVPGLIEALYSDEEDVRLEAADALGNLSAEDGIPRLLELLESSRYRRDGTPILLANALAAIGTPALGALEHALQNNSVIVRLAAIRAIREIGTREAVPALLIALNDSDDTVFSHATEGLGEIGDPRAVPALIKEITRPYLIGSVGIPGSNTEHPAVEALRKFNTPEALEATAPYPVKSSTPG